MSTVTEPEIEKVNLTKKQHQIVVYNDDENTFEHVIDCLIKYCRHDTLQAEQCAWIIDGVGKCGVKSGKFEDLVPIKQALNEKGIDAKIE